METDSSWLSLEKIRVEMEFLRRYRLLYNTMQQGVEQHLREIGVDLTSSQLDVLLCVAQECGRPVNQRDIEEQLQLSNPTVTGILKRMERKGFITRTVGQRDRRYKEVRITEKCDRLGEQFHLSAQSHLDLMFRGLTQEDFDNLNRMLQRLLENSGRLREETRSAAEKTISEPAALAAIL